MVNLNVIMIYHVFFYPVDVFCGEELGLGRAIFGYKDLPETLLLSIIKL